MRFLLRMVPVVVCACLAACGPSREQKRLESDIADIEIKLENTRTDLQSKTTLLSGQTNGCNAIRTEATSRIAELKDTILGIMNGVQVADGNDAAVAGHRWTIAIEDLSPELWTWREEETAVLADVRGNVRGVSDRLTYSVDPRKLSSKVKVGGYNGYPAVELVCLGAVKCISVRGRRVQGQGNTYDRTRDTSNSEVSEMRESNWWAVTSDSESGRLAVATGELITAQSALVSPECEAADKTKAEVGTLQTQFSNLEKELADKKSQLRSIAD